LDGARCSPRFKTSGERVRRFVLLLGLAIAPGAATPAENEPAVIGAGNATCTTWATIRREQDPINEAAVIEWLHGYLSATNEWASAVTGEPENIIASTPANAAAVDAYLWMFIDNYCAENPQETLHAAAAALTQALLEQEGIVLPR
jgi:hypothetical protein